MTLTEELLTRFKQVRELACKTGRFTQLELLYMNYMMFYVIADRDRCQFAEHNDSYVYILNKNKPQAIVSIVNLEVHTVEVEGYTRADRLWRRMESFGLEKPRKEELLKFISEHLHLFKDLKDTFLKRRIKNTLNIVNPKKPIGQRLTC